MFFISAFVTTKPCPFRPTNQHSIISTFLEFHGAHKSRGILFKTRNVKVPYLFFTIFNTQILCCSMVIYHYSNLFINFLIHIQPIHLRFFSGWTAIFVYVICQHFLLFVGYAVIIIRSEVHLTLWAGLDILYYHIQEACHPRQLKYLHIVHMCFRFFGTFTSFYSHLSLSFMYHPPPTPFNSCVTS